MVIDGNSMYCGDYWIELSSQYVVYLKLNKTLYTNCISILLFKKEKKGGREKRKSPFHQILGSDSFKGSWIVNRQSKQVKWNEVLEKARTIMTNESKNWSLKIIFWKK